MCGRHEHTPLCSRAFWRCGYSFRQTLHLASPKMKFYDLHLNNAVWYARHAMSIDENRADFARVPWGGSHNKGPERPDEYPDWLQQAWFAGNHSDVGGSYPENEARLSDFSLGWNGACRQESPRRQGVSDWLRAGRRVVA